MKEIPLTQGFVALVDDEDYELVNQYKWCIMTGNTTVYIRTNIKNEQGKWKHVLMHRLIMGLPKGLQVDHVDHNGCNNQKNNLRVCTHSQNCMNSSSHKNTSSKYKGVCWHISRKKWQSQITVNRKIIHLGLFESEIDAALAYNTYAIKYQGEFANLNVIYPQ